MKKVICIPSPTTSLKRIMFPGGWLWAGGEEWQMREARSVSCWTQKILGWLNSRQEAQDQRRFVQGCRVLSAPCWSTMPPPLSARFCPCGHIPATPIEGCGLHTLEEVLRSLLFFACFSSIVIPFCIRHVSWSVVKHNSRILAEPGWLCPVSGWIRRQQQCGEARRCRERTWTTMKRTRRWLVEGIR